MRVMEMELQLEQQTDVGTETAAATLAEGQQNAAEPAEVAVAVAAAAAAEHRESIDSQTDEVEPDADADVEDERQPLSERWSPLGANYDDANSVSSELLTGESPLLTLTTLDKQHQHQQQQQQATTAAVAVAADNASELARLRSIEDEQELLTSSLLALTSQFAHVQLRVRQIVEAPTDERDQLLRDLEDFAFQGIPEVAQPGITSTTPREEGDMEAEADAAAEVEPSKPPDGELIEQLKSQLTELEQLAYESGTPGVLPQHVLLEKQKFILDELRSKLNLQVEQHQLPELSTEQLRHQVDNAIGEFVGPLKMKEQLVAQLKTQITDLERFIAFLQCDTAASASDKMKLLSGAYNSYAAKQTARQAPSSAPSTCAQLPVRANAVSHCANTAAAATSSCSSFSSATTSSGAEQGTRRESLHSKAHGLLDKASLLMQMFATTHFAKRQTDFQQNSLKKTNKGNHWG